MDNPAPDQTENTSPSNSYFDYTAWKEYQWYRFVFCLTVGMVVGYLALHEIVDLYVDKDAAYEYHKLDDVQKQHIATIYLDPNGINLLSDSSQTFKDATDALAADRALSYLRNQLNFTLDPIQMDSIGHYLHRAHHAEALSFLSNIRLRVKSYFWLTGPEVYFEIMFWCWFGTLAALIFSAGWKARNDTTFLGDPSTSFDPAEIPHQFGKLVYGPLCILAIVFGYNFFKGETLADLGSSKGILAFSFVGGLYTSRVIALLSRLKDVLLPPDPVTVSTQIAAAATAAQGVVDVMIELVPDPNNFPPALLSKIQDIGFKQAKVQLQLTTSMAKIIAATHAESHADSFFAAQKIQNGTYRITAEWAHEIDGKLVRLQGSLEVLINATNHHLKLPLKLVEPAH